MDFSEFSQVEIDPGVMGGTPVLRGTRIPLSPIFSELANGLTLVDIANEFDMCDSDFDMLKNLLRDMATSLRKHSDETK